MSVRTGPAPEEEVAGLVQRAAGGDAVAWEALVTRYAGLVWSVCRGHRLGDADAADVCQTTWLRLVENLGRLSQPERVGAWLATTARRECLRTLKGGVREAPTDDAVLDVSSPSTLPEPEQDLLAAERTRLLRAALETTPEPCRGLLRVLSADPPPSYAEVSAALGMPVGSIGPTRQRCLKGLRTRLAGTGITAGSS